MLWLLTSVALGASPTLIGTIGSDRFWHEHPVLDAHVAPDGTLLTLAGCVVHRWTPEGALVDKARLEGCTPGLNEGFFSGDGAWVAASGLWVGESGVWKVTGGPRVHEVESLVFQQLCGEALWRVNGSLGLERLDLLSGDLTHPTTEHGTGFLCIDDQWILDEHGHRIELDGAMTELEGVGRSTVVGTTGDGKALVYRYEGWIDEVDGAGTVRRRVGVARTPEVVRPWGEQLLVLDDFNDRVWSIGPDGRVQAGPWHSDNKGLGMRRGHGALFTWQDQPWGWSGHRLLRLDEPAGPTDTVFERFFLDGDELWLCHGAVCEARKLDALDGPVRQVSLPRGISSDTALSPDNRFLALYDTRSVYRVELDTGEVARAPVQDWPDGISVDASGHIRWRLSEGHEDDEDLFTTRIYHRVDGEVALLGEWEETDLGDPGWSVLRVAPPVRWADGSSSGPRDADDWFETADGRVVMALSYGSGIEVLGGPGQVVASSKDRLEAFGSWADGVWVGRGQTVHFLGPDLTERASLEIPWPLGDFTVEGVGSPDGRHFAARAPGGRIKVWRVSPGIELPAEPSAAPMAPWVPELSVGALVMAPTWKIPEVLPLGLDPEEVYIEADPVLLLAMVRTQGIQTQQGMLEHVSAIQRIRADDDEVYELRSRWLALQRGGTWYDEDGEEVPVNPAALKRDLNAAVRRHKLSRVEKLLAPYMAPPPTGPAFGLEGCHDLATEPGLTPAQPPSSVAQAYASRPVAPSDDALIVEVAADGSPAWRGTLEGTRGEKARACWRAHEGRWTPAQAAGEAVSSCWLVQCQEVPDPAE